MTKKIGLILSILLLLKAAAITWLIISGYLGLGPDEAQYWTWSQKLDWGYYSKPPGIAWQIWLGTLLFGNSELGVRIGAVAIGTLLPLAVYALAAACRLKPWTCFMAAIIFAFSPLGMASSLLAITDGGIVLFWALATAAFCKALQEQNLPSYYLIGTLILLGALYKWPIYLFWTFVIGWVTIHRQYFSRDLIGGIALSLLGLLPSLIWNIQNDWPTFKHVFSTLYNPKSIETGTTELMRGNLLEFLGAQAVLLSPILFILLIIAFWKMIKDWKNLSHSLQFCGGTSLLLLGSFAATSILKKMQGNWCDFAYPAAIVLLSWCVWEKSTRLIRWAYAGIALSIILLTFLLLIPFLQSESISIGRKIPFKSNPFKHNLGWHRLDKALVAADYDLHDNFLFADRYQNCSILSFYGPAQTLAYFFNLHGIRKNQFSYWNGMEREQLGRTGFFVTVENNPPIDQAKKIENEYQNLLNPYFSKVEFIGISPLFFSNGVTSKVAYIFKCEDYNGKQPAETTLY